MKARLSIMFILAIGIALFLTWAVAGQKAEAKAAAQSSSHIVSANMELDSRQNSSLGYAAPITFTPAFTTFLPVVVRRWPPIPDTPVLNAISNSNGAGDYSVIWNAAYLADTYTLQEDTNAAFTNPTTQYSGTVTSWSASGKSTGTYYYRVKTTNSWGDSGWSNIQSVTVLSYDGTWHGTTSQGEDIWFGVRSNAVGSLEAYYVINSCSIYEKWWWDELVPIFESKFTKTHSGMRYSSVVQGTFTSDTTASGTIDATDTSCGGSIHATWDATKQ